MTRQYGMGLKKTTIRRNITDFMWKQLHGTLKIGSYWLKIPSHREKAYCKECQNLESLNHILFKCQIEGREEICVDCTEVNQCVIAAKFVVTV